MMVVMMASASKHKFTLTTAEGAVKSIFFLGRIWNSDTAS